MKIANVFILHGQTEGISFAKLGVGLLVITSVLHLIFSKVFDKNKKYLHALISAFLIILMLSHADPEPVRGVLVIVLLFGGRKIPELMKGIGQGMTEFKKARAEDKKEDESSDKKEEEK